MVAKAVLSVHTCCTAVARCRVRPGRGSRRAWPAWQTRCLLQAFRCRAIGGVSAPTSEKALKAKASKKEALFPDWSAIFKTGLLLARSGSPLGTDMGISAKHRPAYYLKVSTSLQRMLPRPADRRAGRPPYRSLLRRVLLVRLGRRRVAHRRRRHRRRGEIHPPSLA